MAKMTIRRSLLALLSPLVLGLAAGAQHADAATLLGSPDPSATPDAFACTVFKCPPAASVGFRQFALQGAETVAEEPGILTSARVNAKRLAGGEQPRIAVLRTADDGGIGVTIAAFAPLPVVSRDSVVHEVRDLHLAVEPGDSIGFLLPSGQVELGVKARPQPDGAVQWLVEPCAPCSMDGGTGRELLLDATVEPDDDQDGLGDESQDPDLGLGEEGFADDELDDWDDELDEEDEEFDEGFAGRRRGRLRLLGIDKAPNGDPILKLRTPGRGVVNGTVTTSGGKWDRGIPATIGFADQVRSKRAGRVRLRMKLSPSGRRMLRRDGRQRAVVVVSHRTRRDIKVAMRRFRQ
jgi:hypothetical protein